jgi:hypothetical protein
METFERDPTIGLKIIALLSRYSGLARPDFLFTE